MNRIAIAELTPAAVAALVKSARRSPMRFTPRVMSRSTYRVANLGFTFCVSTSAASSHWRLRHEAHGRDCRWWHCGADVSQLQSRVGRGVGRPSRRRPRHCSAEPTGHLLQRCGSRPVSAARAIAQAHPTAVRHQLRGSGRRPRPRDSQPGRGAGSRRSGYRDECDWSRLCAEGVARSCP
jgi:hypothetical protein